MTAPMKTKADAAIQVKTLRKSFGKQRVLNGIDLEVAQGRDVVGPWTQRDGQERVAEIDHRTPAARLRVHSRPRTGNHRPHAPAIERNQEDDGIPFPKLGALRFSDRRTKRGLPPGTCRLTYPMPNERSASASCLRRLEWRKTWTSCPDKSPEGCRSGSVWREPWRFRPTFCSSTNQQRDSIPSPRRKSTH